MPVTPVPAILTPTELTFLEDHGALGMKQATPTPCRNFLIAVLTSLLNAGCEGELTTFRQ